MRRKTKAENKKNNIAQNRFFLLALFVAAALVPFLFLGKPEYKVVLSDSGFAPRQVTIPEGAKVTWVIDGKSAHWPASNNHPTHTIYPESGGCIGSKLDACKAMKKGEKFSFVFEKTGTWGMHDHLYPQFTMIVNVESAKQSQGGAARSDNRQLALFSPSQQKLIKELNPHMTTDEAAQTAKKICSDLRGSKLRESQHCYSEVFTFIAKNTNQQFAFRTVSELRKLDNGVKVCHLIAHGIGWGNWKNYYQGFSE